MRQIKILYDHQIWQRQKYGGISRYFSEIISGLKRMNLAHTEISVVHANNAYLKKKTGIHKQGNTSNESFFANIKNILRQSKLIVSTYDSAKKRINLMSSIKKIRAGDYDIFHPTYYDPYFIKEISPSKKVIITVHDMTHEIFPELFSNSLQTAQDKKTVTNRADKIIAISQATKNDLVRLLGIDSKKISVIHHACSFESVKEKPLSLPDKYILFVGGRTQHKNFKVVAEAFAMLQKKYNDLKLVCIGGNTFSDQEKIFFERNEIHNHILQINATDGELMSAYKNAVCFVFPSLHEGFGIPILESFFCKCPAILSNASCFPEIAQDAALYFKPDSKDMLCDSIEQIIEGPELKKELINKGSKRLSEFSWEKAAKETYAVYEDSLR